MNVEGELTSFILRELSPGGSSLEVNEELLETGIIDSLGLVQLLSFIESRLQVKVPVEELTAENFRTVNSIARFVEQKRKQGLSPR